MSTARGDRPAFTVVIPAYNSEGRIVPTLRALAAQRIDERWETVVVDSGEHSCREDVARELPGAHVVRHPERLRVGASRNAGVRAACGRHVAFCPDDGLPVTDWLSARLRVHRQGFEAVGGSITNATPESAVGTAGYLLEYSALLPIGPLLAEQEVPHALSFHHSVFNRVGDYPEDTLTGEDTLFNRRCLAAGVRVGFAPDAAMGHRNPTTLGTMLRHAANHGRGLRQCLDRDDLGSAIGPRDQAAILAVVRAVVAYPLAGLLAKGRRLRRHDPSMLPRFARLSPLVALGLLATGWGALREQHLVEARLGHPAGGSLVDEGRASSGQAGIRARTASGTKDGCDADLGAAR